MPVRFKHFSGVIKWKKFLCCFETPLPPASNCCIIQLKANLISLFFLFFLSFFFAAVSSAHVLHAIALLFQLFLIILSCRIFLRIVELLLSFFFIVLHGGLCKKKVFLAVEWMNLLLCRYFTFYSSLHWWSRNWNAQLEMWTVWQILMLRC
jgi:hypothetical protein